MEVVGGGRECGESVGCGCRGVDEDGGSGCGGGVGEVGAFEGDEGGMIVIEEHDGRLQEYIDAYPRNMVSGDGGIGMLRDQVTRLLDPPRYHHNDVGRIGRPSIVKWCRSCTLEARNVSTQARNINTAAT